MKPTYNNKKNALNYKQKNDRYDKEVQYSSKPLLIPYLVSHLPLDIIDNFSLLKLHDFYLLLADIKTRFIPLSF
jgi:hypothetical protein